MGGLLASLPGHFSRKILFGSLLPLILTLTLFATAYPGSGISASIHALLASKEATELAVGVVLLLASAWILQALNIAIIRLFEGYPWQHTLVGSALVRRKQLRLSGLRRRVEALFAFHVFEAPGAAQDLHFAEALAHRTHLRMQAFELPPDEAIVLPTRFGNTIRAAEAYSVQQYGMDSIVMWPRLVLLMSSDDLAKLDDARTNLDFCVHQSVLFAIAAMTGLVVTLSEPGPPDWLGIAASMLFLLGTWAMYELAIARASGWGAALRACVDRYRFQLLQALGIKSLPGSMREERELWRQISLQYSFGDFIQNDLVRRPRLVYDPPKEPPQAVPHAQVQGGVDLQIAKSVTYRGWRQYTVHLQVHNPFDRDLTDVLVTDDGLEGFVRLHEPAVITPPETLTESSRGGYAFRITRIAAATTVELEYAVVKPI